MVGCHGPSTAWPSFARRERERKSAIPVGMTELEKAPRCAWSDQGTGISPLPGGLVCTGIIGVGRVGQFTVESLKFKVKKENTGRGFNAEIAEDAEYAEFGTEIEADGFFTTKDAEGAEFGALRGDGAGIEERNEHWGIKRRTLRQAQGGHPSSDVQSDLGLLVPGRSGRR